MKIIVPQVKILFKNAFLMYGEFGWMPGTAILPAGLS
jgi:hypothetical protein